MGPSSTVAMGTICSLCSAASQFLGWEMMLTSPLDTFLDQQHRVLGIVCRATDSYSFSLFSTGMTGCLEVESKPATPLLFRHVRLMDHLFTALYTQAVGHNAKRRWALAGLANVLLWLWWFRSHEVFSLTWEDVEIVSPR